MKLMLTAMFCVLVASSIRADDWPHWMGPKRDNTWREEGLLEKFPAGGAKIVWRTATAGGYAGPAVVGDKLYLTDYITDENSKIENFKRDKSFTGKERVRCLNANTGSELWSHSYPVTYSISYPSGTRCTPVVQDGKVYTLGAEGNLFCFNAENGKVIWSKTLPADYHTKTALWGYASHPLVDGRKLICVVGGQDSHAVAFDLASGEELWKSQTAKEQGYSPLATRYLLLSVPYRKQLNFTFEGLQGAESTIERLRPRVDRASHQP